MDKKSTILSLALGTVLIGIWYLGTIYIKRMYPNVGQPPVAVQTPEANSTAPISSTLPATLPAGTQPTTGPWPGTMATTVPSMGPATIPVPAGLAVQAAAVGEARPVILGPAGNEPNDPKYAMRVTVSPAGAGLDDVTLNGFRRGEDFKELLKNRALYTFQHPLQSHPWDSRPLATTKVVVDGRPIPTVAIAWSLKTDGTGERIVRSAAGVEGGNPKLTGRQVVYAATITDAGKPILVLTKTFTLFDRATITEGYELAVDHGVQNLTDKPMQVQLTFNGPGLPPREASRTPDRQLMAGYVDPSDQRVSFEPHTLDSLKVDKPPLELAKNEKGHLAAWAGASSIYFNAFVLFDDPAQIASIKASAEQFDTIPEAEDRPTSIAIETGALQVAANGTARVGTIAHFGPRWRQVLDVPHYQSAPRQYDLTLILTSGICGACTFSWMINILVWMLNKFHWLAGGFLSPEKGDWGIAIILLVALVRTILHPITKKSQVQMMQAAKMAPKMQKLKEKYADDQEGLKRAQMELMKEHAPGQIFGCLPMFLQMPIWLALWQALQSTFELRQAPFLWGATWIRDLSRPDYLIKFDHTINLIFGMHIEGINLLPLLMAVVMYFQAKINNSLTPATTDEQIMQKKMMLWMQTLLFPLFLYNGPSGLNLYIMTSTLVGMIESKIIRNHIKEREAAEKAAAPVIVDARPTRAARKANAQGKEVADVPDTGFWGMVRRFQDKMDEAAKQREIDQKKKK